MQLLCFVCSQIHIQVELSLSGGDEKVSKDFAIVYEETRPTEFSVLVTHLQEIVDLKIMMSYIIEHPFFLEIRPKFR